MQSHYQAFGEIFDGDQLIDQVVLSVHRAPLATAAKTWSRSVATVETSSPRASWETCLRAGARGARGEFTERAF